MTQVLLSVYIERFKYVNMYLPRLSLRGLFALRFAEKAGKTVAAVIYIVFVYFIKRFFTLPPCG